MLTYFHMTISQLYIPCFLILNIFILFYVCEYFAWMYVCVPLTCLGPSEGIGFPGTGVTDSQEDTGNPTWVYCKSRKCFGPLAMAIISTLCILFAFWDTVSLCVPRWPGTHYVEPTGLEHTEIHLPLPWVLGFDPEPRACWTRAVPLTYTPDLPFKKILDTFFVRSIYFYVYGCVPACMSVCRVCTISMETTRGIEFHGIGVTWLWASV